MSKPSSRKQEQRKKKRQKKDQHSSKYLAKKEAFRKFPEIVYEVNDAPKRLVEAVKQTLHEIVANHEKLFDEMTARNFQFLKESGYSRLRKLMHEFWSSEGDVELVPGRVSVELHFEVSLGTLLVSRLPPSIHKAFFPFRIVRTTFGVPVDDKILLEFLSMDQRKTEGGTAYFAAERRPFFCGDEMRKVAFTRHAIERICERCVYDPTTYEGLLQAFAICNSQLYATSCLLPGEQLGVAMFQPCLKGMVSQVFAEEVLGEYDSEQSYLYRVGYGPVVLNGDLAIAKTLLLPGMEGTPEYEKSFRPHVRTRSEREAIRLAVGELTFKRLIEEEDFTMMKQFHDDGIPQVLTIDDFIRDFSPPPHPASESPAPPPSVAVERRRADH